MSLVEALKSERYIYTGPKCATCMILDSLTKDDRAALEAAFADASFTTSAIHRALKSQGHVLSAASLSRHRRSECRK